MEILDPPFLCWDTHTTDQVNLLWFFGCQCLLIQNKDRLSITLLTFEGNCIHPQQTSLLGSTKTGTVTDFDLSWKVRGTWAVIQSSLPSSCPSFPNSRTVGSSRGGNFLPTLHKWWSMSCSAEREIIVDWAPVSSVAVTFNVDFYSQQWSNSSNMSTRGIHSISGAESRL